MKPKTRDPLVEKVARAIVAAEREHDPGIAPWNQMSREGRDYTRAQARAAIRTIRRHDGDRWRDAVSDPPEDGVMVLIWHDGMRTPELGRWCANPGLYHSDTASCYDECVTHWRPLPPPPKAKAVKS